MVKAKAKDEKVKNVLLHQSSVIGWILVIVDPEDASIRGNDVGKKDSARKEDKNCLINWKDNGYIFGDNTSAENYTTRKMLRCGKQIETQ